MVEGRGRDFFRMDCVGSGCFRSAASSSAGGSSGTGMSSRSIGTGWGPTPGGKTPYGGMYVGGGWKNGASADNARAPVTPVPIAPVTPGADASCESATGIGISLSCTRSADFTCSALQKTRLGHSRYDGQGVAASGPHDLRECNIKHCEKVPYSFFLLPRNIHLQRPINILRYY